MGLRWQPAGQCCRGGVGGTEYSCASQCAEVGVWSRIQGGRAQCCEWGVCGPVAEGRSSREILLVLSRLGGRGGGYRGAPSAVSQASTSPSTLCFSLVLINGCSAVPPIKSNLLKRFGVLICNQRVAAFITMEMAQAVLSRPAAGGRCAALQFGWGRGSERGEGRCVTANGAGRQREAPRPAPCGTGRHERVLCFGTGCGTAARGGITEP